jgi:transposase-like protein
MWKQYDYDDEFKRNALRKVFDGQSVRSVAEELGVKESLIHKWKRALLLSSVAGQDATADHRLESGTGDDCRPCDFGFRKSH